MRRKASKSASGFATPLGDLSSSCQRLNEAREAFGIDVLTCDACGGAMTFLALVKDPRSIETYLRGKGDHLAS